MLTGKTVLLGISGSIAAYKIAQLASSLKKLNADVHVLMTENATKFISPITFETLTGNRCIVDTFDRETGFNVAHVDLAKKADIFVLAPATANVIAKVVHGIADDMVTTTFLACTCPKYIAPAMNTNMYKNKITGENLHKCSLNNFNIIHATRGYLACGDTGIGKMAEPDIILEYIKREIAFTHDLEGKRILITAGPTRESLDPVRFITNKSTGKMGYALAKIATYHGAYVTLITGETALEEPMFASVINVSSAKDMFEAVKKHYLESTIIIKAAAVADYRPITISDDKIKKSDNDMKIELERTDDILNWLGQHKGDSQLLCGFSMETRDLIENSKKKLKKKNIDMIVANNLKVEGAGFGTDTNVVTVITKSNEVSLDKMSKDEVANEILSRLIYGNYS